jgi:hypothetical protein
VLSSILPMLGNGLAQRVDQLIGIRSSAQNWSPVRAAGSPRSPYSTGYSDDMLDNPGARAEYQGAYVTTDVNFVTPNPAVQKMLSALKKYVPSYKATIPGYGVYDSYISMDLMIKGLELAGKNPTPAVLYHQPPQVERLHSRRRLPGARGELLPQDLRYIGHVAPDRLRVRRAVEGRPLCAGHRRQTRVWPTGRRPLERARRSALRLRPEAIHHAVGREAFRARAIKTFRRP